MTATPKQENGTMKRRSFMKSAATGAAGVAGAAVAAPAISQSGFGMYVKYLMAGCLIVFAASMATQFASYFLESVAVLRREGTPEAAPPATDSSSAGLGVGAV